MGNLVIDSNNEKDNNIIFSNEKNKDLILLKADGDIFVKGKLIENDKEVVEALREFLGFTKPNFNLSNRVCECLNEEVWTRKDIKEFIGICIAEGWDKQFGEANKDIKKGIQFMKEVIFKYAGNKLNGK